MVCKQTCIRSNKIDDLPGETNQNLSNKKLSEVLREKDDKDEANTAEEGTNDGFAIPKAICDPSVQEKTKNLSAKSAVRESRLPCSRKLIRAIRLLDAVCAFEGGIGIEIVDQGHVKPLHDDTGREEDRPTTSLPVKLERLDDAEVLFILHGSSRFLHSCLVDMGIRNGDPANRIVFEGSHDEYVAKGIETR